MDLTRMIESLYVIYNETKDIRYLNLIHKIEKAIKEEFGE